MKFAQAVHLLKNNNKEMSRYMIYLDWAATAPLSSAACEAMRPFLVPGVSSFEAGGANANALYKVGRDAFRVLEQARKEVAASIGAKRPFEVVFTSGATEADNAALFGMVDALMLNAEHSHNADHDCVPEIVISSIEHDAVLQAARVLNQWGAHVRMVKPDSSGHISPSALEAEMSEHTILVSIMAVNNEIGSVMDVASLAKVAHRYGALFHSDATQALGKLPLDVCEWDVDALSISSHKVGGPKGVGALYLKERTPFSAQIVGGGQESARRSGTQNVMGAVGFAAACTNAQQNLEEESTRLITLRDYCYKGLLETGKAQPVVKVGLNDKTYAPHIVSVLVPGFESETLILRFDNEGICVSGGSACSSHSLDPSHVLRELNIERDKALSALRVSLGRDTTKEDIDIFLETFKRIVVK